MAAEDYTSPIGYLESEFFNTMGPLVVLIFAIGAGARAIAGEEEVGHARPAVVGPGAPPPRARHEGCRRRRLPSLALAAVAAVAIAVLGPPFDLSVPLADLLAACVMLALLGLAFGGVALAVGTATGRRTLANAVAGGLAVLAFIVNTVGPTVDWLRRCGRSHPSAGTRTRAC